MTKYKTIVGAFFLSLLVVLAVACSSNDKKDEGTSPDVAEATSDTGDEQAPPADGAPPADQAANPPADANSLDTPPADPNAAPAAPGAGGDMAAAGDQPPADPNSPPPGDTPPADPNAAPAAPAPGDQAAITPPADATPPAPPATDSTASTNNTDVFGGGTTATGDEPPKRKHVALAHIKDAPFTKGGQNLNTVYIARDGDTLETISQKLFGEDHTKDLKKANPTLKKSVKTGDKVYFNSPNRVDDKEKMMTVYEDQGLPPSVYTTKEGDTLKSLAQEWYGSEGSYKEIYAINKSLTSTTDLPAGTELQYWPASATVAVYGVKKEADVAEANAGAGPGAGQQPPPMTPPGGPAGGNVTQPPAPPANQMAQNPPPPGMDNNPPPAGMGAINNNNGNMPPPPGMGAGAGAPPPDMNAAPPPAPPMAGRHKTKDLSGGTGAMDKDTIFYAGLAGILLISSALWFALRRRRSRNNGVTQI